MIKLLLILLVGIGLGYTYGYMHAAAGERSVITSTLEKVGVHRAEQLPRSASSVDDAEAERQARADSARARSAIRPSR